MAAPARSLPFRWLLLIHQVPRKPDYLRVKIRRRLHQVGAIALKHTVYVLPCNDESLEDFQWVLREIADAGGQGTICEANLVAGASDAEIETLLRAARRPDGAVRTRAAKALPRGRARSDAAPERPRGRTWVTRKGVYVDRIASAWLIRRFIDPKAKFKFVTERDHKPVKGELRFDMYDGEFTHEGDRCTFEVLVERFVPGDRALLAIAEIIHDLDIKDGKFGRDEARGIERLIAGIAMSHKGDRVRIERGSALFDDLHAFFTRKTSIRRTSGEER